MVDSKWHVLKISSLGREFLHCVVGPTWVWTTEQHLATAFDSSKEAQAIIDNYVPLKSGVAVVRFTHVPVKERLEVLRERYEQLVRQVERRDNAPELVKEQQSVWEQILLLAQKGEQA